MMIIKKFKNGKIKLQLEKKWDFEQYTGELSESIYHDDMFMENLYIDTINGCFYIIDTNKQIIYDYFNGYFIQNPLKSLLNDLESNSKIYLYPSDIDYNDYLNQIGDEE